MRETHTLSKDSAGSDPSVIYIPRKLNMLLHLTKFTCVVRKVLNVYSMGYNDMGRLAWDIPLIHLSHGVEVLGDTLRTVELRLRISCSEFIYVGAVVYNSQIRIAKPLGAKGLLLLLTSCLTEEHIINRAAIGEKFFLHPLKNAIIRRNLINTKLFSNGCRSLKCS